MHAELLTNKFESQISDSKYTRKKKHRQFYIKLTFTSNPSIKMSYELLQD